MNGISLDRLLESRDQRQAMQRKLLACHPMHTLVCLTVIMPGAVKRNEQSLIVAKAAVEALQKELKGYIIEFIERDLITGYEAFAVTDISPLEAKRLVCSIEESHPLGRLFDIDVLDPEAFPIPRESVGLEARRCILCSNEARYCMRMRSHSQEELHSHINSLIDSYVRGV